MAAVAPLDPAGAAGFTNARDEGYNAFRMDAMNGAMHGATHDARQTVLEPHRFDNLARVLRPIPLRRLPLSLTHGLSMPATPLTAAASSSEAAAVAAAPLDLALSLNIPSPSALPSPLPSALSSSSSAPQLRLLCIPSPLPCSPASAAPSAGAMAEIAAAAAAAAEASSSLALSLSLSVDRPLRIASAAADATNSTTASGGSAAALSLDLGFAIGGKRRRATSDSIRDDDVTRCGWQLPGLTRMSISGNDDVITMTERSGDSPRGTVNPLVAVRGSGAWTKWSVTQHDAFRADADVAGYGADRGCAIQMPPLRLTGELEEGGGAGDTRFESGDLRCGFAERPQLTLALLGEGGDDLRTDWSKRRRVEALTCHQGEEARSSYDFWRNEPLVIEEPRNESLSGEPSGPHHFKSHSVVSESGSSRSPDSPREPLVLFGKPLNATDETGHAMGATTTDAAASPARAPPSSPDVAADVSGAEVAVDVSTRESEPAAPDAAVLDFPATPESTAGAAGAAAAEENRAVDLRTSSNPRVGSAPGGGAVRGIGKLGRRFRGIRQRLWGRWAAEVRDPFARRRLWLGSFDSAEEAARAYDVATRRLRGPWAKTNFPLDPRDPEDKEQLARMAVAVAACAKGRYRTKLAAWRKLCGPVEVAGVVVTGGDAEERAERLLSHLRLQSL
ncbi:unnamed protein product [Closterium sp. NIES-64]|nr:unnamed protein product [Closterium sp. NIES-64]